MIDATLMFTYVESLCKHPRWPNVCWCWGTQKCNLKKCDKIWMLALRVCSMPDQTYHEDVCNIIRVERGRERQTDTNKHNDDDEVIENQTNQSTFA